MSSTPFNTFKLINRSAVVKQRGEIVRKLRAAGLLGDA
jgi:hypothetical protein